MEPEERDRKKAFIFEYKREKEPFPLTPSKQTLFSIHDSGRSQPLHTNIAPFVSAKKKGQERGEEERKSIWKRVSGSALCKVTVVVYLLGCVLVSALYVALYGGQSQKLFAASDAWIPGKVCRNATAEFFPYLDLKLCVNIHHVVISRRGGSQPAMVVPLVGKVS